MERSDDVACDWIGVTGPSRGRLELGELADRGARLLGIDVEGGMGHVCGVLDPCLRVQGVEAVGDQGEPVGLPEEPNQPGCMPGKVNYPEAGNLVAFFECPSTETAPPSQEVSSFG